MKALLYSSMLAKMIDETRFATCRPKDVRPTLEGILFQCDGKELRLVATDTHRLSIAALPVQSEPFEFIVPAKDLPRLKKILVKKGPVTIQEFDGMWVFTTLAGSIDVNPVSGQFPNYSRVIPTETAFDITADRADLLAAFAAIVGDRPSINTEEKALRTICVFDGGYLLTYNEAQTRTGGCDVSFAGPTGQNGYGIACNGRFMLDALNAIDTPTVRMRFQDRNVCPFIIDAGNPDAFLHLLMPMSMNSN